MATLNKNLHLAKKNKNDEFYTQLSDIENELIHYKEHFKNKTVYCNCDDPRVSNFFRFFSLKFQDFKLKKLITACYKNQNPDLFSKNEVEKAIYLEYKRDEKGNLIPYFDYIKSIDEEPFFEPTHERDNSNCPQPEDIGVGILKGDGDFRSKESIKLLKKADIVVTNPPFSLFREYVEQLIEYDKKFIILGDQNAITYKEIFALIKKNKLWLGCNNGGIKWFNVHEDYDIKTESRKKIVDGKKYFSMGRINWYTNLEHHKRLENLILGKNYTSTEYQKYDNYNAINVDKVIDIPKDYDGVMGVPITFLDKYNPNQFEILGKTNNKEHAGSYLTGDDPTGMIKGKKLYHRILIKKIK